MIADSIIEAEYIAASEATKEVFWFKKFITELGVMPSDIVPLYCDNNGTIALTKEPSLIRNSSTLSGDSTWSAITSRKNMSK